MRNESAYLETPDRQEVLLQLLQQIAGDDSRRVYAVLDGAQFENLPSALENAGLQAHPIVRAEAGKDLMATGPWVVDPYVELLPRAPGPHTSGDSEDMDLSEEALAARADELANEMKAALDAGEDLFGTELPASTATNPRRAIHAIFEQIKPKSGVVFWIGPAVLSLEKLHGHLRGINKVFVPKSNTSTPDTGLQDSEAQEDDMVIFRHADPNVLAQVLPALDKSQLARFFGPADEVLFMPADEWGGRLKRARKAPDLPPAPADPLRLHRKAMQSVEEQRRIRSRRKTVAIIRRSAPKILDGMDDEQAMRLVEAHERQGRALGLRTERGLFQWTYLMAASEGQFIESDEIRTHLTNGKSTPDRKLDRIMRVMSEVAQEDIGL